jgi:hypothetical protein
MFMLICPCSAAMTCQSTMEEVETAREDNINKYSSSLEAGG